jgi:hypothetical protein
MKRMSERGAKPIARLVLAFFVGVAIAGFCPLTANAEHGGPGGWHDGSGGGWHGSGWRGSAGAWHGGHWYHGWYGGRFGWWWYIPGYDWYAYYDAPVYPYPAYPYAAGPVPSLWYYCQNPAGYYPYVQQCAGPWQPVAAPGG